MGAYKRYKVILNVDEPDYEQWVGSLVQKALRKVKVDADTVEIYAIAPSFKKDDPSVYFRADENRFILRILLYMELESDNNGFTCAEKVAYALYEVDGFDTDGAHIYRDNPIAIDTAIIRWDNDLVDARFEQLEEK